jgi:hypothetical protein
MVKLRAFRPPPRPVSDAIELRLGVHDSSRVEWAASVGLPESGERHYEVQFTLRIPAHLYSPHNVWDQKQTFTRLQSPSEEGQIHVERVDLDELRRDTLGVAHRLKQLREKFERACTGASVQLAQAIHPTLEPSLNECITQSVDVVEEMRAALGRPVSEKFIAPEVRREWDLADEFLSHRLLDLLGAAQRSLDEVLMGERSRMRDLEPEWVDDLRCRIAEALAAELEHRRDRGWVVPGAASPTVLSRFVERGSMLKKHFQDVLFLDVEAYMVDARLRNWTGVMAACLAATFWLGFTLLPFGPGARAGIGLLTFGTASAIGYAMKDRIKELTRAWLAGRLTRMYGQRAVRLRLPARVDGKHSVLLEARETFDCTAQTDDDALNRDVGRTQRQMVLTFRMKVELRPSEVLRGKQIRSIKHVFRYDLDPIFSRLDNAVKPVPILDEKARRVLFVEAPKEYRVPVRVVALQEGQPESSTDGVLVLSKRGIERLEPAESV